MQQKRNLQSRRLDGRTLAALQWLAAFASTACPATSSRRMQLKMGFGPRINPVPLNLQGCQLHARLAAPASRAFAVVFHKQIPCLGGDWLVFLDSVLFEGTVGVRDTACEHQLQLRLASLSSSSRFLFLRCYISLPPSAGHLFDYETSVFHVSCPDARFSWTQYLGCFSFALR